MIIPHVFNVMKFFAISSAFGSIGHGNDVLMFRESICGTGRAAVFHDFPKLYKNNQQYIYEMNSDKKAADQIEKYKQVIVPILIKNDVDKAGIFGSFARDEANEDSDIDILVHFKGRKSLFDLARIELELERESRRKVDVITYDSVNPLIREHILKEEVKIL